jgi:hypothetical protein
MPSSADRVNVSHAGWVPSGEVPGAIGDDRQVAGKCRGGGDAAAGLGVLGGWRQHPAGREHHGQDQHQRRQQAARATRVELGKPHAAAVAAVEESPRDQESGDDEEHVHADEAARGRGWPSVEGQHRENRHGPQAVDVGPVTWRHTADRAAP